MRNMAVLHSPAFSYPLPVLVRVLFNLLIFKGKILYYNKYMRISLKEGAVFTCSCVAFLPKRCRIRRNATPFWLFFDKNFAFSLVFYKMMVMLNLSHFVLHL